MYATIVEWIRWTPHPETWLLIGSVIAFGGYTAKVIEPKAVAAGEPPISSRQRAWFVAGVLLLWFAADWPLHDLGEHDGDAVGVQQRPAQRAHGACGR